MKHFTIHIFGYGETQINGDEFSVKVKTNTLTKVQPLIDAFWDLKPAENESEKEFHAINIFSYEDFSYMSKKGFNDKITDSLKVLVDDLIAELKVAFDTIQTTEKPKRFNQPAKTVTPPNDNTVTTPETGTDTSATTETTTGLDNTNTLEPTPPAPNMDAPTS